MKKTIIIILSGIFFLIGAAVVAPFVIDLNKHKARIIGLIKPHLHRDLNFDNIKLTIIEGFGVELQGLRIKENPEFGEGDFLGVERLHVKVKLLPLLKKQIQVRELILDKPSIHIIRNSKGEFNYQDLTQPAKTVEPVKERERDQEEKDTGPIIAAGFMVSELSINNGIIHFIDDYLPGGPVTSTIKSVDIELDNVSLDKPVYLSSTAQLPGMTGQNFEIKGTLGPLGKTIDINRLFMDITLSLKDLSVDKLRHFTPESSPVVADGGILSADLHARGDIATGITSEGVVQCTGLTLLKKGGGKRIEDVDISLKEKTNVRWEDGSVVLEQFDLTVNDNTVSINGNIAGIKNTAEFDLEMLSHVQGIDKVMVLISPLIEIPPHLEPEGEVFLQGSLKGTLDDISIDAGLSSPGIAFRLSPKSERHSSEDLLKNIMESIDIKFIARKKGDKISGDGTIKVEKGEIQSVAFQMMQAGFIYKDDLLTIQKLQAQVFQGNVVMSGTMDPKKLQWHVEPVIRDASAGEAIDKLTQYTGIFKGLFSGKFSADGSVTTKGGFSLDASGSFRLAQGEIRNINLIDTILDSLLGLKDISGFLVKEKGVLYQQETTQFDSLDGDVFLTGNVLNLKRVVLHNIRTAEAADSDVNLCGTVYLDKGTLNLKGEVVLSSKLSVKLTDKAKPLKALLNPEGRLILPVTVAGTISKPKPFLDTQYVLTAMMKYYAGREIEKGLEKLGLPGKEDEKKPELDEEKRKPLERLLDEFLKDIPLGK